VRARKPCKDKPMYTSESKNIQKIISFLPDMAKKEAIDYLEFLYGKYVEDLDKGDKAKAFEIIDGYKGNVKKWTREELHAR